MSVVRSPEAARDTDLRVLVVDDSAVARQIVSTVLASEGGYRVCTASDGLMALDRVQCERPDVIVLDLEMPRLDGLSFLRRLMAERPVPVVVCSAMTGRGTQAALRALQAGAVEVLPKSALAVRGAAGRAGAELVRAVRAAAQARPRALAPRPAAPAVRPPVSVLAAPRGASAAEVIAIGASTGGTEALRTILSALPADSPPVVVAQHMPAGFTTALARSLDQACAMRVVEATSGLPLARGTVYIAPGGRHLTVRRTAGTLVTHLTAGPTAARYHPGVDILFDSVAAAAGARAMGVILTGMGDDGADGLLRMRQAGARTIGQDEASCVVYGMPREAALRGAVAQVLPLGRIAAALCASRTAAAS
jgi:two-component system chemotaxis response regulator CheB